MSRFRAATALAAIASATAAAVATVLGWQLAVRSDLPVYPLLVAPVIAVAVPVLLDRLRARVRGLGAATVTATVFGVLSLATTLVWWGLLAAGAVSSGWTPWQTDAFAAPAAQADGAVFAAVAGVLIAALLFVAPTLGRPGLRHGAHDRREPRAAGRRRGPRRPRARRRSRRAHRRRGDGGAETSDPARRCGRRCRGRCAHRVHRRHRDTVALAHRRRRRDRRADRRAGDRAARRARCRRPHVRADRRRHGRGTPRTCRTGRGSRRTRESDGDGGAVPVDRADRTGVRRRAARHAREPDHPGRLGLRAVRALTRAACARRALWRSWGS